MSSAEWIEVAADLIAWLAIAAVMVYRRRRARRRRE